MSETITPSTGQETSYDCYVINLAHRTDRWSRFEKEARLKGLTSYKRFPAISGKHLVCKNIVAYDLRNSYSSITRGHAGCWYSHYTLAQRLLFAKKDYYVILEDDITMAAHFTDLIDLVLRQLRRRRKPFDIHMLGWAFSGDDRYAIDYVYNRPKGDTRLAQSFSSDELKLFETDTLHEKK